MYSGVFIWEYLSLAITPHFILVTLTGEVCHGGIFSTVTSSSPCRKLALRHIWRGIRQVEGKKRGGTCHHASQTPAIALGW